MTTYRITAHAEGDAEVEVEAENEEAAITKAYGEHLTGIIIDGGTAVWHIDRTEEVEA